MPCCSGSGPESFRLYSTSVEPRVSTVATKCPFYAARGVDEAILVDLDDGSLRWFARRDDSYAAVTRSMVLRLDVEHVRAALSLR